MADTSALHHPPHLGDLLVTALNQHADTPVVHIEGHYETGAQVADQISRMIQALAHHGVTTGTPLGVLALNRPEVLYTIGAGQVAGIRRTALHPLGSLEDHAYVLADAGIETLLADPVFAERAQQLLDRVGCLRQVLTYGPAGVGTDIVALAERMHPAEQLAVAGFGPEHVVALTYTGGTTGRPKGVLGTARSMAAMTTIQLAEWEWPVHPKFLICTPLSHAGAAFFTPTVLLGGSLVVIPRFDPVGVFTAIQNHKITAIMLVPTMLYALLDHPRIDEFDLSSLQTVFYGASAMNPARLTEAIERFGPIFAQYYGQTECPMAITYLDKDSHAVDHPYRLSSCGKPSPLLHVALLDESNNPVEQGDPGEICVRGPAVCNGYHNLPQETADAFHGGWLHTGDIARSDAEGYWYIVDRKKDMIITGGFNVFPREIEDVIAEDPAVAQVAVIGVPDDKWGEAVKAVVVARPGTADDDDARSRAAARITALVRERKGTVHTPKSVDFTDAIPVSALGKPDKKALRARYWGDAGRLVN